jgi:hypothetical protein
MHAPRGATVVVRLARRSHSGIGGRDAGAGSALASQTATEARRWPASMERMGR